LAPEILEASKKKPNITKQDVWSIGVFAYQLCTLRLPFTGETPGATIVAILTTPHDPIPHKLYSDELKGLINLLITKDPEHRPSIQQLIKVPIIRNALEALIQEFEGKVSIELRNSLNDKDSALKSD
jgi:serine/threonine protein kinase